MELNGLLIDCARLQEPREYYERLLGFMAQWKMEALILHFSDDHGCVLKLRGFGELAVPGALTPGDLEKLLELARSHGIDVIPELETFGHTRYITDKPGYRHLSAGRRTRDLELNAIDPLHKDTLALMRRLIRSVARAFPSPYIHLGCDEVDLSEYCRQHGLPTAEAVWTDYVSGMIEIAREAGKIPMIWADHVVKSDVVAERLRKDVVLVEWKYWETRNDDALPRLARFGFREILVAPSIACYRYRFYPPRQALQNIDQVLTVGRRHGAQGVINTVWCPWRYLQNALYYGIAYGAYAAGRRHAPDIQAFNRKFARETFGTGLAPSLKRFLDAWPEMGFCDEAVEALRGQRLPRLTRRVLQQLRVTTRMGNQAMLAARDYVPQCSHDIWHGMVLSAECAWLCAESLLLQHASNPPGKRKARYNQRLSRVRKEMREEWSRTRDPEQRSLFPNEASQHAMHMIRKLRRAG